MSATDALLEALLPRLDAACGLPGRLSECFLAPEDDAIARVRERLDAAPLSRERAERAARELAAAARRRATGRLSVDTFLREYSLGSEEGVLLMCLAEALIRIPDDDTARLLVEDKLGEADFERHIGHSHSLLVNASTWALALTGRLFRPEGEGVLQPLRAIVQRLGEGVALSAIRQAMTFVGEQFVVSESIEEALARTRRDASRARYSFDMLGEAAVRAGDADAYCTSSLHAIEAVGAARAELGPERAAISIKLSALDARYEPAHRPDALPRLMARLRSLIEAARAHDVQITIDAEEAYRLHLSLEIFESLYRDPLTAGFSGFGLAVQAYQKRAPEVIDWLASLADDVGDRIPVRLVKGAYWDTELKRAQVLGLAEYPVFVHKAATDCAWLACADRLLATRNRLYGQFASHNAHSLVAVLEMARRRGASAFELQRLYGMGDALFDELSLRHPSVPQRIYAPVGDHRELLPYLMRRLLENGANSSFIHHLCDASVPLERLTRDPRDALPARGAGPRGIPLPQDLYAPQRPNSHGLNLDDERALRRCVRAVAGARPAGYEAAARAGGEALSAGTVRAVRCPADLGHEVGRAAFADARGCSRALEVLDQAFDDWRRTPVEARAGCLDRAADAIERQRDQLMALCTFEAGKTLPAALGEVREAADFCRYYAARARAQLAEPSELPGPTGEENRLWLEGRGPFLAIAPWNFPLAIFTGQVAAALVAGNTVLAKPSELTPLLGDAVVRIFLEAGVPPSVLAYVPAPGDLVGATLVCDPRVAGVAFTGATRTARAIARTLARRNGPFVPLIAETGGQNAMIVDSSALAEQVVRDVVISAFDSGGQRCSALRMLYVQEDTADELIELLAGAVELLRVGHPLDPATDVGPVISADARDRLERGIRALDDDPEARRVAAVPPGSFACDPRDGHYVGPVAYEVRDPTPPHEELFGPVLRIVRYRAEALDEVLARVRRAGYALTGGVHSRIARRAEHVAAHLPLGNLYVNRNIIGSVVGTQPFGGFGLSGTGPKAGGPHYLFPFTVERATTVNTAAVGGDPALLGGDPPGPG